MSRLEEARRLRAKADSLRAEADHLEAFGDQGAQTLRRLANGFERDAARYERRCVGEDLVTGAEPFFGWKHRQHAR